MIAGRARWALCFAALLTVACGGPIDRPDEDEDGPPDPSSADAGTPAGTDGGEGPAPDGGTDPLPDGGDTDPGETDGGVDPSARCAPEAGGPYWLVEGETVSFELRCATGWSDPARAFEIEDLPAGARLDPGSGAFTWTPGLHQAATFVLTLRETHTGETGQVKVGVADRFDRADNTPVADPATYQEEFGLPVMHLFYEGKLSKEYAPARLVYRGHTYHLQAKFRGATSMDFPKRSYTLKFSDDDEFEDPAVGFGKNRDKLALVTTFNDNSYVRSRLGFELWKRMDPRHISVETFPVVVFVNGYYRGVYTSMDLVDSDLMKAHGLPKDGQLFKAFHADANFSGYTQDGVEKWAYWQGYEKKEGFPEEGEPGAMDPISDLTEFVATSSDADLRAHLGEWIDLQEYGDWWIFASLILGTDSGAKNACHYQRPEGGPFRYIPWDLDASFGQAWDTRRTEALWRMDFRQRNNLFRRMLLDPALIDPVRARHLAMLRDVVPKEEVLAVYDQLQAQVHDAALRDELRWKDEYRDFERWRDRADFTTYEEEAAYVRAWIGRRWDALIEDLP